MTMRGVTSRRPPIDAAAYSTENVTRYRLVEFGISLAFVLRVRTLLYHRKKGSACSFKMLTSVHVPFLSILFDKGALYRNNHI